MNDKNSLSGRKKSIMIIDKKGTAERIFKKANGDDATIKECLKGGKTINRSKNVHVMGKDGKKCECEMCLEKHKKCEKCKKEDLCECEEKNGSTKQTSKDSINEKTNEDKKKNNGEKKAEAAILLTEKKSNTSKSPPSVLEEEKVEETNDSKEQNKENVDMSNKESDQKESTTNKEELKDSSINKEEEQEKEDEQDKELSSTKEQDKDLSSTKERDQDLSSTKEQDKSKVEKESTSGKGIILGKSAQEEKESKEKESPEEKSVTIDEGQNKEYSVDKDSDKSLPLSEIEKSEGKTSAVPDKDLKKVGGAFVPPCIPSDQLPEESEIKKERENDNVICEGHIWKRRRIFACFWHEKYFVLTKTGLLKYHKANGTKYAKGNWDLKKINRIHEIFLGTENHPYRLALVSDDENLLFGFDDPDTREFWYNQFAKFIDF